MSEPRPPPSRTQNGCLVEVEHLKVFFPIKEGFIVDREVARVHAVNDVTFKIDEGETVGLVGESGCGKTTMSRAIMRLIDATDGHAPLPRRGHHAGRPQADASRCGARCRWSSRTRSRRSTRASAWCQIIGQPLRLHGTPRGQDRASACASCSTWSGSHPST